jgi:hypothetical protein
VIATVVYFVPALLTLATLFADGHHFRGQESGNPMHLQQTKVESRASGGPQYYFHDVPDHVKDYLRGKGACPVVLTTPYGIAESPFMALGKDHKLADGEIVAGNVGHDRIQQAGATSSIGEAIRDWYSLKTGDFERIDVEVEIHKDGHFILTPMSALLRNAKRAIPLERIPSPLSFHRDYESKLWRNQIRKVKEKEPAAIFWAQQQISKIIEDQLNEGKAARFIHEADLVRASGALAKLGLQLGAYHMNGYDCPHSVFAFNGFPVYPCPVEVKKRSSGFSYQITKYTKLPRVVVLCLKHDLINPPSHIDILELPALAKFLN